MLNHGFYRPRLLNIVNWYYRPARRRPRLLTHRPQIWTIKPVPVQENAMTEDLQAAIAEIKARNSRVDADKAWETSRSRTLAVAALTYLMMLLLMAVIGVNGMMSGVASMDFGGKRGAGTATGLIDGFVYFGTAAQDIVFGNLLPAKGSAAAKVVSNWHAWPLAMLPVAIVGIVLSLTVWNARVAAKSAAH